MNLLQALLQMSGGMRYDGLPRVYAAQKAYRRKPKGSGVVAKGTYARGFVWPAKGNGGGA